MNQPGVLVVEDNELNRDMLARRLRRHGYAVATVADGPAALDAIAASAYDLILLDIEMPGMSGLEVLRRVRERHSPADLPVVMVSARQDSDSIVSALNHGANDYVTKPIDFAVALARVDAQLARRRLETARRTTDPLTGLPNRGALVEFASTHADVERPAAVLSINLDRFRNVNNGLGRSCGDRLLVELAARVQRSVPAGAMLARIQGDDFACLLPAALPDDAMACGSRLIESVRQPFDLDGQLIVVTASVGIACDASMRAVDELIEQADTALYRAKTLSGGRWEVFDSTLHSRAVARLQLEMELQQALVTGAFDLRYEPIIDLESRAIVGCEALVRWKHPRRGEVGPTEFIPVAEETRLIVPLGKLVFRQACDQRREWQERGILPDGFMLAVNVSARELDEPAFVDALQQTIETTAVDPRGLRLEMTESVLLENSDRLRLVMDRVRALGVQIVLDDFGTGYSSLSYLQHFSLHGLKIDRSFVQDLSRVGGGEIARTLIRLAQELGMEVVAEGVESAGQIDALRALGCRYAQGYFFCRPLTAQGATAAMQCGLAMPQWSHVQAAQENGFHPAPPKGANNVS